MTNMRPPTQRIHNILQPHPKLIPGPSPLPIRLLLLHDLHRREEHLRTLNTNNSSGHVIVVDIVGRHAGIGFKVLDRFDAEADGAHAVHGRGGRALLEVAGDAVAGFEFAFAGGGDHVGDYLDGVAGVG